MTLDEIRKVHERTERHYKMYGGSIGNEGATDAHQDRAQLLAWLDAALPFVQAGAWREMSDKLTKGVGTNALPTPSTEAIKLLAQMGVKP